MLFRSETERVCEVLEIVRHIVRDFDNPFVTLDGGPVGTIENKYRLHAEREQPCEADKEDPKMGALALLKAGYGMDLLHPNAVSDRECQTISDIKTLTWHRLRDGRRRTVGFRESLLAVRVRTLRLLSRR